MHRIPKLFSSNKSKQMESKSQPSTPTKHAPIRKLLRKNAVKNIHYEASTSASMSASTSSDDSLSIRNHRSIDVYPWGDRTSFRISGNEGELEQIWAELGLTGPDDFGIDPGDFEDMKARSGDLSGKFVSVKLSDGIGVSDDSSVGRAILGVGGSNEFEVSASVGVKLCGGIEVLDDSKVRSVILGIDRSNEYNASVDASSVIVGVSDDVKLCIGGEVLDDSRVSSVYLGIDGSNEFDVKLRDGVLEDGELCSEVVRKVVLTGGGRSVGGGIRGERPPAVLLAPPPSMSLPVVDDACTFYDIVRSFGPDDDTISRIEGEDGGASSEDERERGFQGDGLEGDDDVVRSTNSNDDDSSSTTTDPMSISPNGILRRRISSWGKGRHLGSGSFGSVYEGIADGGFFFAVKEVSLLDQGDKGREIIYQFEQEMAFLSQFEHKNIVRYLGTDKDDSNLYIFLELAFGSLLSLYQRFRFRDSHVSGYTRQILEGLKYLHERSVVHRDIKCANILLDVDGNAKLADFGLAKVDTLNDAKSCKGTSYWMAPEVVQPNKGYGCPADIWSLGCTVLEMLTQNFPYHPMNGYQAMFQIGSGKPPPVPNVLSKDAQDFILKCLQVEPETRPSAAELLEHPFVKKPHPASTSPHHHGMHA